MAVVGNDEKLGGKLSYLFLDKCSVYQTCKNMILNGTVQFLYKPFCLCGGMA